MDEVHTLYVEPPGKAKNSNEIGHLRSTYVKLWKALTTITSKGNIGFAYYHWCSKWRVAENVDML